MSFATSRCVIPSVPGPQAPWVFRSNALHGDAEPGHMSMQLLVYAGHQEPRRHCTVPKSTSS